jgi:hypothetical protein
MKPATALDTVEVDRLVRDLDSTVLAVRERAAQQLERMGPVIGPRLERAVKESPSAEVRERLGGLLQRLAGSKLTSEELQFTRALWVLERIGSADARRLLEELAGGADGAPSTLTAKTALKRLTAGVR